MPRQRASCRGGWFLHIECVDQGLDSSDTLIGLDALPGEAQALLLRTGAHAAPAIGTSNAGVDVDEGQPEEAGHEPSGYEANELRYMDWWDNVDVMRLLAVPVPTLEAPPPKLEASFAQAKLEVLRAVGARPEDPGPWKLLLFMDRLLMAKPALRGRSPDIGKKRYVENVIVDRLRSFWRGEWQAVVDEARLLCPRGAHVGPIRGHRGRRAL